MKIFTTYILDVKVNVGGEDVAEGSERIADETFTFKSKVKMMSYKSKVLENVNKMDPNLVFKLYYQLAHEIKKKLEIL